jgi:hypothetical protein
VISALLMISSSVDEPLSADSIKIGKSVESVVLVVSPGLSVEDRLLGDGLSDGGDVDEDGDVLDEEEDADASGSQCQSRKHNPTYRASCSFALSDR